ncbi:MAG: hypothetical protein H6850_02410 [Alphaproteobacteria bacterium]|nr:MAG: hypothetical protein H6850_02410 [Alphaproteobacteria bacterium]
MILFLMQLYGQHGQLELSEEELGFITRVVEERMRSGDPEETAKQVESMPLKKRAQVLNHLSKETMESFPEGSPLRAEGQKRKKLVEISEILREQGSLAEKFNAQIPSNIHILLNKVKAFLSADSAFNTQLENYDELFTQVRAELLCLDKAIHEKRTENLRAKFEECKITVSNAKTLYIGTEQSQPLTQRLNTLTRDVDTFLLEEYDEHENSKLIARLNFLTSELSRLITQTQQALEKERNKLLRSYVIKHPSADGFQKEISRLSIQFLGKLVGDLSQKLGNLDLNEEEYMRLLSEDAKIQNNRLTEELTQKAILDMRKLTLDLLKKYPERASVTLEEIRKNFKAILPEGAEPGEYYTASESAQPFFIEIAEFSTDRSRAKRTKEPELIRITYLRLELLLQVKDRFRKQSD